jgi:hypothetical protein
MYELTKFRALVRTRRVRISAAAAALSLLGITLFLILDRDAPPPAPPDPAVRQTDQGFTFFSLGENTVLTPALEERLEGELGSSVRERWAHLDLSLNYPGFLPEYFPELAALNRRLKETSPLRPEENPIRLTFRHTRRSETPFQRVDLVFSPYTRKPIFFRITPQKEKGAAVIETLQEKYGPYQQIDWDGQSGQTLVWRQDADLLLATITPDRYGDPSYRISIYYVDNLRKTAEIKERNASEDTGSGVENAF